MKTREELEAENRDLMMRLSAIKMIVNRVAPVCAQKLGKLLQECEDCDGGK